MPLLTKPSSSKDHRATEKQPEADLWKVRQTCSPTGKRQTTPNYDERNTFLHYQRSY